MSSTFNHDTLEKLLKYRKSSIITDFEIFFSDQTFPCHKAIAVLSSPVIASAVASGHSSLLVPEEVETTIDVVNSVLDCFYGQRLEVNVTNGIEVFEFAQFLGFTSLKNLSKTAFRSYQDQTFTPSLSTILSQIQNDQFTDYTLVYNNSQIKIHKFLLTALCPVLLTKNQLEPDATSSDYSQLLTVEESSFADFFNSFYKDKLDVTLETIFDLTHLASYFKMKTLEAFCHEVIQNSTPSIDWVFPALIAADEADDFGFIEQIASVLGRIETLSEAEAVAVQPDVFGKLSSNVDVYWLTKVLVHSFLSYSSNKEENHWTPSKLEKCLLVVSTIKIPINVLFSYIKPLLNVTELHSVLAEFSLTRFTNEQSEIPSEWVLWLMVEMDKNESNSNESVLTSQFSEILSKVFTPQKLSTIEPIVLSSDSLRVYIKTVAEQYLVFWFIKCLIKSWNTENGWNVEIFDEILSLVNVDSLDPIELIRLLHPIEQISNLFHYYCKFITTKVTTILTQELKRSKESIEKAVQEVEVYKTRELELKQNYNERIGGMEVEKTALMQKLADEQRSHTEVVKKLQSELHSKTIHVSPPKTIQVGSRVRVQPHYLNSTMKHGRGSIKEGDIGIVKCFEKDYVRCDFPSNTNWGVAIPELEVL
ncbi:hypothetical protein RCL1_007447 [Eukaryota sp. TZLM3-RCL]